jgi:hypothetical protein
MMDFDWAECPRCCRTVPVVAGVLGTHMTPKEARRWPKMGEECPRSATPVTPPMPLLGDI